MLRQYMRELMSTTHTQPWSISIMTWYQPFWLITNDNLIIISKIKFESKALTARVTKISPDIGGWYHRPASPPTPTQASLGEVGWGGVGRLVTWIERKSEREREGGGVENIHYYIIPFLAQQNESINCDKNTLLSNRKWQDYVYIQCEYKSTKQFCVPLALLTFCWCHNDRLRKALRDFTILTHVKSDI